MAFTFAAFSYIVALIVDAFLIFFAIFHVSFFQKAKIFDVSDWKSRFRLSRSTSSKRTTRIRSTSATP